MKISVVNKWDIGGGAARAAYRLADMLVRQGHDLKYIVNIKESLNEWIYRAADFSSHELEEDKIQSAYIDCNRTSCSNTYFSYSRANISKQAVNIINNADAINLHWIEKFISPEVLAIIANTGKPIIWTLHDERPLTGGCHYTNGCKEFIFNGCKNCIQLSKDPDYLPSTVLKDKLKALSGANLTIVTPSKWLGRQARTSSLFRRFRVEVIPNSLETDVYKPIDKALAKKKLGLDPQKFVILFGAQNASEKRKGYEELCDAMRYFNKYINPNNNRDVHVLTFGENTDGEHFLPIPIMSLGTITDDNYLAEIYSAADIFVLPSKEDNLPNTILEAFACGTPVIGFDIGGVGDLVVPNETGFLVPVISAKALALSIYKAYTSSDLMKSMSVKCADKIRMNFTQKQQALKYISVFEDMMG